MKKTQNNLILLNCIFVVSLIVANIVSAKIAQLGMLTVPAAIVCYPLTFLMTDVIGELWGKKQANKTVLIGFVCQCISLLFILLSILLPVASFADNQENYKQIMSSSFRVVIASIIAYLFSQNWDVAVFHYLRNEYIRKNGSTKGGKWIWNNASTMTSQMIDTIIFITIAFYGTVPNIWQMVASQYLIKFVYAIFDTPFFYLLTKENDRQ